MENKYSVTVRNISDLSPAANTIQAPVTFNFEMTPPVFDLKFMSRDNSVGMGMIPAGRNFDQKNKPKIVQGKFGAALRLSGEEQSLIVNDSLELNPVDAITISVWIKPDDWNGNRRILQKGNEDNQYRLFADNGKLAFDIAGAGAVYGTLPSVGEWHNVAATYDGLQIKLYVDGVQIGSAAASGKIGVTTDQLNIGTKSTSAAKSDYFKGDIDKITIWNYALSEAHIKNLAKSEAVKK